MKDKIRQMVEDVECKVSKALSEEIRRLGVLVDEFSNPFHPDPMVLNVYKKELHRHVESGLGSNLRARLSTALAMNMENSQKEMTERMSALVPGEKRVLSAGILPRREPFEVLYRLNCDNLCSDFQEDISFKFSFGIRAIMKRVMGRNQYGFFGGGSCSTTAQIQVTHYCYYLLVNGSKLLFNNKLPIDYRVPEVYLHYLISLSHR